MGVMLAARKFLGLINLQGWVGVIVGATLGALLFIQTGKTHAVERTLSDTRATLVAAQQTIINYQQAAAKARADDAANKARAEAEQKVVVERTKADYEVRIARARADAQRLRDRLEANAHLGSPGKPGVSGDRGAGPAAPGPSADQGLSIDERLTATEQAIQLDALIDYVEGILKVNMNGSTNRLPAPQAGRK